MHIRLLFDLSVLASKACVMSASGVHTNLSSARPLSLAPLARPLAKP